MFKNTISAILNENANINNRKKIIRQYCLWSGALYFVGGLLAGTAAVWIIFYMNYIHKNINQYVQSNGSTGTILAMTVFFLMVCCLLLVTLTLFVHVIVRLYAFARPSKVRCTEPTITGKAVKVSLSEKQTKLKTK